MAELGSLVAKVRSKNAGPFWLTIDIFCGSEAAFSELASRLATDRIAQVFGTDAEHVSRYDIPSINVVKFSLPRPSTQGAVHDRDMHGASWAVLVSEIDL